MARLFSVDKALKNAKLAEGTEDWATAVHLYQGVLDQFPKNRRALEGFKHLKPKAVRGLLHQAQVAQAKQHWAKSQHHLELAFSLAQELPQIGIALAHLQLQNGHPKAALDTTEVILSRAPDTPDATSIKGMALRDLGRMTEAKAVFESLPESAESLTNLAILARAAGDAEAEFSLTQKAVLIAPKTPSVHWNFSNAQTYDQENEHLSQMLSLARSLRSNDPTGAPLYMALFKAFDDIGEVDTAFSHLQKANALNFKAAAYDLKKDALRYAVSKNVFSETILQPAPMSGDRQIFVTGLPRSGTTLVERILAQDPSALACGELSVVERTSSNLIQQIINGELKVVTPRVIDGLHAEILDGFKAHGDANRIKIDKLPLNFRWIGFICAALPNARIIHLNRDPMAVAWSLYRHAFSGRENGFAYSFEDIVKFMVLHRELMTFWRQVCPHHILDVDYCDLVNDTEKTTRKMAEFTGLTWSEAWLHPDRGDTVSLTASAVQVRKPIYKDSDAGWKRYEHRLAPLKSMLQSAGFL